MLRMRKIRILLSSVYIWNIVIHDDYLSPPTHTPLEDPVRNVYTDNCLYIFDIL